MGLFHWTDAEVRVALDLTPRPETEELSFEGISTDSRTVREGDLFVAVRGMTTDGHRFVASAIDRGAVAVAVEEEQPVSVPQIVVSDARAALAWLAAAVYGDPSRRIDVIGVTGTNGKTTVTTAIASIREMRLGSTRLRLIRTPPPNTAPAVMANVSAELIAPS